MHMEPSLLWMICVIALGLALLLAIWLIRLRMELWANRRALAVLERAERFPERRKRSRMPDLLLLGVLLLVLYQIIAN
jgi:hypothetical protein